jgi:hypothetical protein
MSLYPLLYLHGILCCNYNVYPILFVITLKLVHYLRLGALVQ